MMIRFTVEVPQSGTKDPYIMTFEESVETRDVEQSIDKVENLPDAVRKFVEESIDLLGIKLQEQKQINDEQATQEKEDQ